VLPVTKVSLPAAKSIACHTPFVTDFFVPIADSRDVEDLTFLVMSWKAKAAVQLAGSTSLSWRAPVQ